MLKKNTECEQKEPQLSKGKVSIGKDSKVKLSKEDQTIRAFLDSHNLSTIDSRYEKKLYNLFREKNKDTADCVGYCQYVYDYLHTSHKSVDAKLLFTVSLKQDVLIRFLNNKNVKNQKEVIIGMFGQINALYVEKIISRINQMVIVLLICRKKIQQKL